jgi:hypothetical protein
MSMATRDWTDEEIRDPELWDPTSDIRLPPVANPRAQVVISFDEEELARVDRAAERRGETLIAFIRRVAFEQAQSGEGRGSKAS